MNIAIAASGVGIGANNMRLFDQRLSDVACQARQCNLQLDLDAKAIRDCTDSYIPHVPELLQLVQRRNINQQLKGEVNCKR